jgi:pheromone shutdown protein TraB
VGGNINILYSGGIAYKMKNKSSCKKGVALSTLVMIIIFAAILLLFIMYYSGSLDWLLKSRLYPSP